MVEERCPVCGSAAKLVEREGYVILVRCESCHSESYIRIHPAIEQQRSIVLTTKVYKAFVDIEDPALVLKSRMRVKRVFGGFNNFSLDKLERQIARGDNCWDLGVYDDDEVEVLQKKAEEVGLKVSFFARQWDDSGGFSFPKTK